MQFIRPGHLLAVAILAGLSACGTTYNLPELNSGHSDRAEAMFAEAQQAPRTGAATDSAAAARFRRVSARIQPVAESLCERETAERANFDCSVGIGVDTGMPERNAYFAFAGPNNTDPQIRVTVPMLRDVQNDDELAFVMAHEYGHLIGRHIEKQQQQALAGAIILGSIAAVAAANDPYASPDLVSDNVEAGAALGKAAFSQTYELESDTLGTVIAHAAGYNPVLGARYFARAEKARQADGNLSFWGTHPPNSKRIATVLATLEAIEIQGGITRKPQ